MDEAIMLVYMAYLGKEMGQRLVAICKLVRDHEGKDFFKQYSTSNDSIMEFLNKCEARDLKLW